MIFAPSDVEQFWNIRVLAKFFHYFDLSKCSLRINHIVEGIIDFLDGDSGSITSVNCLPDRSVVATTQFLNQLELDHDLIIDSIPAISDIYCLA